MSIQYDLLPKPHFDRDRRYAGLVALPIIGLVLSSSTGIHWLMTGFGIVSFAAACAFLIYLKIAADRDNKALAEFFAANTVATLTEQEMWESLPPCFASFADRTDIVDAGVRDGYVFPLSENLNCLVFLLEYVVRDGNRTRHHVQTIAMFEQPRLSPHIFLDSKLNGAWFPYHTDQLYQLEGNFNNYFNTFIPKGAEIPSLEILTPDVMQVLVRNNRLYDVEFQGQIITLIGVGNFYTRDMLRDLFSCVAGLYNELNDGMSGRSVDEAAEDGSTNELVLN